MNREDVIITLIALAFAGIFVALSYSSEVHNTMPLFQPAGIILH